MFSFLLLIMWARLGDVNGSVDEVTQFLSDNGYHYVDILQHHSSMKWYRSFKPTNIYFSRNSFPMAESKRQKNHQFSIFMFETKMDNMKDLLRIIGQTNVKESLLILDEPRDGISELKGLLEEMNLNAFFYLLTPGEDSTADSSEDGCLKSSSEEIERFSRIPLDIEDLQACHRHQRLPGYPGDRLEESGRGDGLKFPREFPQSPSFSSRGSGGILPDYCRTQR